MPGFSEKQVHFLAAGTAGGLAFSSPIKHEHVRIIRPSPCKVKDLAPGAEAVRADAEHGQVAFVLSTLEGHCHQAGTTLPLVAADALSLCSHEMKAELLRLLQHLPKQGALLEVVANTLFKRVYQEGGKAGRPSKQPLESFTFFFLARCLTMLPTQEPIFRQASGNEEALRRLRPIFAQVFAVIVPGPWAGTATGSIVFGGSARSMDGRSSGSSKGGLGGSSGSSKGGLGGSSGSSKGGLPCDVAGEGGSGSRGEGTGSSLCSERIPPCGDVADFSMSEADLDKLLLEAKAADQLRGDRNAAAAHPLTIGVDEDRKFLLDVLAQAVASHVPPVASCTHLVQHGMAAVLEQLAKRQHSSSSSGQMEALPDLEAYS